MLDTIDIRNLDLANKVTIGEHITLGGFSNISQGILLVDATSIQVAIKSLRVHGSIAIATTKERLLKRFYREVLLWRRLQHSNIVPLLGFIMHPNESPSLVSPWYINGNVIDYLALNSGINRNALALDVVNGLDYLHSIPVAHGDLKGENVLVNANGRASLCDFGMSQFIDEATRIVGFTTTNAHLGGTDRYMCPELLEDEPKTTATDMWALGCLVMQIMTDVIPYSHISRRQAVLSAIMRGDLPMTNSEGRIEWSLWDCIMKCWSITPGHRPKAYEIAIQLTTLEDITASFRHLACSVKVKNLPYPKAGIKFSPDGKYLAIAGADGAVGIWEVRRNLPVSLKTWTPKQTDLSSNWIWNITWSTSQQYLFVNSRRFTKVFMVEMGELRVYREACVCAGFLPAYEAVAFLPTQTGEIPVKDLTQPDQGLSTIRIDHPTDDIDEMAFSPTSQRVMVVTRTALKVYSIITSQLEAMAFLQHPWAFKHISLSQDGQLILVSSANHDPELWRIDIFSAVPKLFLMHQYKSACFGFDLVQFGGRGDQLVLGLLEDFQSCQHIHIWDRDSAQLIHSFAVADPCSSRVSHITFSWNSTDMKDIMLALVTESVGDNTLEIWSVPPSADSVSGRDTPKEVDCGIYME